MIPLNNQTMGFNSENYINILKERENKIKEEEEREIKHKEILKKQKPFYDKLKQLRNAELENLLSNRKFLRRCKKDEKNGWLTRDYHEYYINGGCGYTDIDLVYEYGSIEYKSEYHKILKELNNIN